MRKTQFITLIILLAVGLSACGNLTPPTVVQTAAVVQTTEPEVSNTDEPQTVETPVVTTADIPTPIANPACRVNERATMDPALEAVLPKGDREWSQGPDDAYVTIIEYSDFQ